MVSFLSGHVGCSLLSSPAPCCGQTTSLQRAKNGGFAICKQDIHEYLYLPVTVPQLKKGGKGLPSCSPFTHTQMVWRRSMRHFLCSVCLLLYGRPRSRDRCVRVCVFLCTRTIVSYWHVHLSTSQQQHVVHAYTDCCVYFVLEIVKKSKITCSQACSH